MTGWTPERDVSEPASPIREGGACAEDVAPAARIVLAAARCWAHGPAAASPCFVLRTAGVGHAAASAFLALLALLRAAGRPRPVFLEPGQPGLTAGERGMLDAVAALQQGEPWRSQRVLAAWLAPAVAPRAVALMAVAAQGFTAAGLRLGADLRGTLH